jgi:hypothetical protein
MRTQAFAFIAGLLFAASSASAQTPQPSSPLDTSFSNVATSFQGVNAAVTNFTNLPAGLQQLGNNLDDYRAKVIKDRTDLMSQYIAKVQWWSDCWDGKIPGCGKAEWSGSH